MFDAAISFINDEFRVERVSAGQMDSLLAAGWRHFGTHFFRYNLGFYEFDVRRVIPLRIRLSRFSPSKSQRRVLRRNADLRTIIRPIKITEEAEELFHRHKRRFKHGVPDSIYDFLSRDAASSPVEGREVAVFENRELVAVSYFDIGSISTSGIYATFDPENARRGLGIFTMLKEIEFSLDAGKEFYYQGYAYEGESFYDYKKRFRSTEGYDWNGGWATLGNLQ